MDTRARIRLLARGAALAAALGALAAPATAGAAPTATAAGKLTKKQPVVYRVTPSQANVGGKLTLYGKNFRRGKGRNSVAFKAEGKKAIFVRADISTRKQLKVVLPEKLVPAMSLSEGLPVATPFKVRVLAKRFGKRFTKLAMSPRIGPALEDDGTGNPPAAAPEADCDGDGIRNADEADDDDDLLNDGLELRLKLDPCKVDSDGDGVSDGFEYKSAVDLNDDDYGNPQDSVPSPDKRLYPNPLDGADARTDFDGDSLELAEEYELWLLTIRNGAPRTLAPLSYSDGEQYSKHTRGANGRRVPTLSRVDYDKQVSFLAHAQAKSRRNVWLEQGPPWAPRSVESFRLLDFNRNGSEATTVLGPAVAQVPGPGLDNAYRVTEKWYFDFDNDGFLSDDERDEDADGLTNYDETHGRMLPEYWESCYSAEPPFPVAYRGTSAVDGDTDGDGLRDGLDDQDHDDIPNVMELSRIAASGLDDRQRSCVGLQSLPKPPEQHHPDRYGYVNPFNPCLPATWSRTCSRHPSFSALSAPFETNSPYWFSLN